MPSQIFRGGGHHQPAVLDPFDADQLVGDLFDCLDGTADNQDLQAVVVVEVHVVPSTSKPEGRSE